MKKGTNMKKEDLVHLHVLLAQLKIYCVDNEAKGFEKYDALGITPFQIHRSKEDHYDAILVLATDLTNNMPKALEHYKKKREDTALNLEIGEYLDI